MYWKYKNFIYKFLFDHDLFGRLPEAGTPMLSMYDGVYLEKRQAEYYLGLFTQDQRDKAGNHSLQKCSTACTCI